MVAIPMPAGAQTVIGILTSVTGRVTVVRPGSTAVPLKARDTLSLGELATVVKLRERTRLSVDQTARRTILFLVDGAVAVAAPIAWQIGEPSATRVCVFTGTAVVSALGGADDPTQR